MNKIFTGFNEKAPNPNELRIYQRSSVSISLILLSSQSIVKSVRYGLNERMFQFNNEILSLRDECLYQPLWHMTITRVAMSPSY